MIKYNSITLSDTEPSTPINGDWWIKAIASTSYQVYFYLSEWKPTIGGGVFKTETSPDVHYINTVIQDAEPTDIQPGWVWLNETAGQAYMFVGKFVPILS